jgi:adenylate cyclase
MTPEEFSTILERIAQNQQTDDDLEKLRSLGSLRLEGSVVQWVSQDGKFNTNVGQITGGEVHIGDRIYQGTDAEAIRSIIEDAVQSSVAAIQQPSEVPKYQRPSLAVAMLASVAVALAIVVTRSMGLLQSLELTAYDGLFRTKPFSEIPDDRITIVEITNEELNQFGTSEISDRKLQQILETLVEAKPFRIGLDIFRDESQVDPEVPNAADADYQDLIQFLETNQIVTACKVDAANVPGTSSPSENIRLGFSNVVVDEPGDFPFVRRQLLSMPIDPNANCQTTYSLGYQLALDYLEEQGITESRTSATNYIQLGETIFEPVEPDTGGYEGIDDGGYQILLNYRRTPFDVLTATQILDGLDTHEQEKITDRIILVGYNEEGSQEPLDLFKTPLGISPGVTLHAYTISHILSAVIDDEYAHPRIRAWIEPSEIVWIMMWCAVGGILAWIAFSRAMLIVVTLSGTVLIIAIAWSAFVFGGWWLPLIPPMLGLVLTSVSAVVVTQYRILQKR